MSRARTLCVCLLAGGAVCCQGAYSIPPTLCDDWCDAEDRVRCGDLLQDPADCVSRCELRISSSRACKEALEPLVACLRNTPPGNAYCMSQPCSTENVNFYACGTSGLE